MLEGLVTMTAHEIDRLGVIRRVQEGGLASGNPRSFWG